MSSSLRIPSATGLALTFVLMCAPAATYARSSQHGGAPSGPAIVPAAVDQMQTAEITDSTGTDPLTPSELTRVARASAQSDQVQAQQVRASRAAQPGRTAKVTLANVQFLFAERHDEDKDAPLSLRRADMYFYDYSNDEVLHQIVNAKTGAVESSLVETGQQPPVTSVEATAAVQLILDNPQLGPTLRRMHRLASGQDLQDASDIGAQGGIFYAGSAVGTPLAQVTDVCGLHRCVQLFLPYDERHFIDASNLVVDLSAGQVLWVNTALMAYIDSMPVNPFINVYFPFIAR